jgi:glutathione S-transferase
MLALYHFGDAICAQKVRLALAEKGLAWESRDVSGPGLRHPDYLKLNPNGVVPTLVHDEAVLIESRIISEYVEDAFEGPALMPRDPHARHRARDWSKQIDDSLHLNVFIVTFVSKMRDMFLKLPTEVHAKALPGLRDAVKRQVSIDLLDRGWDSQWPIAAVKRFKRLFADMEAQLAQTAHLAGPDFSLADADFVPYFKRFMDLGLDSLWADKGAVQDWWAQMQARPSYKTAILDWDPPEIVSSYAAARARFADPIERLIAST